MGVLHVKLRNAKRERLDDSVDLQVVSVRTNMVAGRKRGRATQQVTFELAGGQPYIVKAFPSRHRPVGRIILMPIEGSATAELYCPLDPERVRDVRFPHTRTFRSTSSAFWIARRWKESAAACPA